MSCGLAFSNPLYDHKQAQSENDQVPQSIQFISTWLEEYIGKPCSEQKLPYKRSICPFVPKATAKNFVYYVELPDTEISTASLSDKIRSLFDAYKIKEPLDQRQAVFKTLVVILPNLLDEISENVILDTQLALKPEIVEQGYMIGEFTPKNELPGEYSRDFKPSRCPLPMLVIRSMTKKDLKFMHQDKDGNLRSQLLEHFSKRFGSSKEIDNLLAEFR